jgi:hypothetical protein
MRWLFFLFFMVINVLLLSRIMGHAGRLLLWETPIKSKTDAGTFCVPRNFIFRSP